MDSELNDECRYWARIGQEPWSAASSLNFECLTPDLRMQSEPGKQSSCLPSALLDI